MNTRNQSHLIIVFVWVAIVLIYYQFILPSKKNSQSSAVYDSAYGLVDDSIPFDAIVLIAMSKMAEDPMIDFGLASIRKVGKWNGDIYILTDRKGCFSDVYNLYDVQVIEIQPVNNIMNIKVLKTQLFKYLPLNVQGVLYLDVDIIVTRDLSSFIYDLQSEFTRLHHHIYDESTTNNKVPYSYRQQIIDLAAFLDAKGHYVGFCSGCEKWHTGVLWLPRPPRNNNESIPLHSISISSNNSSNSSDKRVVSQIRDKIEESSTCLQGWESIILSGKFDTDQQALDLAETTDACQTNRIQVCMSCIYYGI